jgi:UDP-glucuronate 4-epimerase
MSALLMSQSSTINKKRILLTGGAGFIGSHLAEALLSEGVLLTIVDNFDEYYPASLKEANLSEVHKIGKLRVFRVDISDDREMRNVFDKTRPEIVIHLAARPSARHSLDNPQMYERINVAGTIGLLELSRTFAVNKFIFGSSSSVYGAAACLPFSEDEPTLRPLSPYAVTKLAGELWSSTYAHLYGMQVICLRLFTAFGPRQRPDLAIFKFVSAIEGGEAISIFGDGNSERDYTFVADIISGIIGALQFDVIGPTGNIFEIFNLGSSRSTSLWKLIQTIETATGRRAVIERKPVQLGDLPLTCANIAKARRLLKYAPKTTLEQGVIQFVSWYRERFGSAFSVTGGS